jgi:hypothetical protein
MLAPLTLVFAPSLLPCRSMPALVRGPRPAETVTELSWLAWLSFM